MTGWRSGRRSTSRWISRESVLSAPAAGRTHRVRIVLTHSGQDVHFEVPAAPGTQAGLCCTALLDDDIALAFLIGDTHEATLVASGRARADGDLAAVLAFTEDLPTIAARLAQAADIRPQEQARLDVLRRFHLPAPEIQSLLPVAVRAECRDDQLLIATLIVLGLGRACRQLELSALISAHADGSLPAGALVRIAELLAGFATRSAPTPGSGDAVCAASDRHGGRC